MALARRVTDSDIEHMKVMHSRDVVFNETSMPGIHQEGTTVKYVELEIEEVRC